MINGGPSRWAKTIAKSSAVVVLFLSLMALGNWATGFSRFHDFLPASPKMAAGTALLFLLLGLAVWVRAMDLGPNFPDMSTPEAAPRFRDWFSKSCAAITVCVALLRLFGHLMARDFGLDRLWFHEGLTSLPARMAPATCVSFIFVGCGLLLVRSARYSGIFQGVILLSTLVAWLGLSHYLFGGQPLLPFSQMAIQTAFSFLVICLGILCLRPDVGLVALLSSDTEGGTLARRLVPSALFVPLVLGLLRLQAQRAGWFGTEAGVSLFALANVVIFGGLIWANAAALHRTDSERRKTEAALSESHHRLRNVLDSIFAFVGLFSTEGILLEVNRAPLEMAGLSSDEVIGKPLHETYWFSHSVTAQERVKAALQRAASGEVVRYDEIIRAAGDRRITIDVAFAPVRKLNGEVTEIVGSAMEITLRVEAETALRFQADQMRILSARIQAAREEERTLVARELHDEIGQILTALKYDISWLSRRLPAGSEEMSGKINSALTLADTGHQWVRKICTELRPGILDDLGLAAAIEWQAREFESRTKISCSLDLLPVPIDLDQERSTAIFRIFQETLTNVSRHAQADHVDVSLRVANGALLLVVKDDGKGIDTRDLVENRSFGVLGMRERAWVFGGRVEFTGIRGKGTTVSVFIPLSTPQEKEGPADANPAGR